MTLRRARPRRGGAGAGAWCPALGHDRRLRRPRRDLTAAEPPRDPTGDRLLQRDRRSIEQLARTRLTRALPRGMELSHFMVLNHFARLGGEKTPAQLARVFHVTRGAMSNTLQPARRAPATSTSGPTGTTRARKWVEPQPRRAQAARDRAVAAHRAGLRRRGRRASASAPCAAPCRCCAGCARCSIPTEPASPMPLLHRLATRAQAAFLEQNILTRV